jgi:hypothetical protein
MAFLVAVIFAVIWLGVINYKEAVKTETSKSNGEALVSWLTETGLKRFDPDTPHEACKGGVKPAADVKPGAPIPGTWGPCFAYLMAKSEIKELVNPFFNAPPKLISQCVPSDRTVMGTFMIENLVATPPGSANPLIISPISDATPIDTKLQLRMSVCDKGGYAIKISEFDF